MLYLARGNDLLWLRVWQLHPVVEQVVRHPVGELIDTGTSWLLLRIKTSLNLIVLAPTNDPVVFIDAVDLTNETDLVSPTHDAESLYRVLQLVGIFLAETNVSPL